uniref:Uncharacterized protein n=1 Tax=Cannabis sativa TaxID=3483 RepID=A0A803PIF0_CANSA
MAKSTAKFHLALTITNGNLLFLSQELARAAYLAAKTADLALWKCLDTMILQWIYALFQDNKASRANLLEEDVTTVVFKEHHTINNYYNYLQSLVDWLADVDAPVSNGQLMLRLTGKGKGSSQQGGANGGAFSQQPRPQIQSQWPQWQQNWEGWTIPHCPFPAYSWQPRPNYMTQKSFVGPGVLKPKSQAFNVMTPSTTSYT